MYGSYRFYRTRTNQGITMRSALLSAALIIIALGQSVYAQHEGHTMPAKPAATCPNAAVDRSAAMNEQRIDLRNIDVLEGRVFMVI